MTKSCIEILAPAKNLEYGTEAVKAGADSLYIGAPRFSMRKYQSNSLDDIKKLIEYAHKYYVRIYAAVNCLLYTKEDFEYTEKLINDLYKMRIDGIIIQDLGILELDLPPVPVILSTNTMCFTKEAAQFYEKCGVFRIVLPRELSFEEIKNIAENSNIEIETFCYGFLCAGISGNCYLAYAESLKNVNDSDKAHYTASNHGLCTERCMGHWTLKDADGNIIRENDRLLNLRYLNLIDELERLYSAGVNSFKIAGREKDLIYVKNITALYSMKADEIAVKRGIKRLSSGRTISGFKPGINKSFNKGHTDFFLNGRKKEMYSKYTLIGEKAGLVKSVSDGVLEINAYIKISPGDRFRYKIGDNPVKTFETESSDGNRYRVKHLDDDITGLEIYRYFNAEGFKETERSVNYRVIPVTLKFKDGAVSAADEDGNEIQIPYKKGNKKLENPLKDLYRLNDDCEFIIDRTDADEDIYIDDTDKFLDGIFTALRMERAKNRPVLHKEIIKNNTPYYKKELTYLDNAVNEYAEKFFKRHGVQKIEPGLETRSDIKGKKIFESKYCLRNELGLCSKLKPENTNPFPWSIEQLESGIKYEINFDCKNCMMSFYLKEDKGRN